MQDMIRSFTSYSRPDSAFCEGPTVPLTPASGVPGKNAIIADPSKTFQSMLGFGSIWTDTDIYALLRMSPEKQEEALQALFNPETGAGWSFMRLPFGSTDWERTPDFYTYDDMPRGEKDWKLEHFSVARDVKRGLFKVARRCKEINPAVTFFGSVWGMPAWMKENDSIMYGRFDPACTEVYAKYLTKCVQAYAEEGIELYAVTPQNESLTGNDRATPATRMTWWVQKEVALAMRREFDAAGLSTRVWVYDHNFDMSDFFVAPMLEDAEFRKAIDGIAFHDYGGDPYVMGELFEKYPDINFYMTERTITTVPEMVNLVKELRNGARSYAQWTTMSDEYGGPHVYGGNPFVYRKGVPTPEVRRNFLYNEKEAPDALHKGISWGVYGIFTKFIRPGVLRIDSSMGYGAGLASCAFLDPASGEIATIVVNPDDCDKPFTLRIGGGEASFTQPGMSVSAYIVTPGNEVLSNACPVNEALPEKAPAWDLAVTDIRLNGPEKAGAELPLSCVVTNVGNLPTPEGATLFAMFSEDGDNQIARSYVPLPVLQPGESFEAVSNVPFGQPYCYRVEWLAEAGHHQIFARVTVGGAYTEEWIHNNVLAKEYFFE